MGRVLLWIFTLISFFAWLIGEETFLVFYFICMILTFFELFLQEEKRKGVGK